MSRTYRKYRSRTFLRLRLLDRSEREDDVPPGRVVHGLHTATVSELALQVANFRISGVAYMPRVSAVV